MFTKAAPSFFTEVAKMAENPVPLSEQAAYVQRDAANARAQSAWQENAELREALRLVIGHLEFAGAGFDPLSNARRNADAAITAAKVLLARRPSR